MPESDNHSIQLLHCKCGINPAAKCYPYCQQCGKRHVNSTSCCQGYNRASAEQRTGSNCQYSGNRCTGNIDPIDSYCKCNGRCHCCCQGSGIINFISARIGNHYTVCRHISCLLYRTSSGKRNLCCSSHRQIQGLRSRTIQASISIQSVCRACGSGGSRQPRRSGGPCRPGRAGGSRCSRWAGGSCRSFRTSRAGGSGGSIHLCKNRYPLHYLCGFFVNYQDIFIFWILFVPIWSKYFDKFTFSAFCCKGIPILL